MYLATGGSGVTSWLLDWVGRPGSRGSCMEPGGLAPGRVLSSQFLALCQLNPSLVVELAKELLEFMGSVSNIHSRAGVFTSVVSWAWPLLPPADRGGSTAGAKPLSWA